ncbi:SRPBCC family protein [Spirillospora sp. CA-294931]|uniref:SRPBCC family protein n=1 Tax=Spirillospora sp. CA-294931 TaxID=3240042 RepID=UPI003D911095
MSTITESVDVAVPVRTAYNQWTQFESFPHFMEGVESVTQHGDTMTHWKIKIGGVEREFDARIVEQHPDERVAWESVAGPKHAGVVTFHRLDETHSRVTLQMETDPEGLAESAADAVGLLKRRAKGDLGRFSDFIESRGGESGAWRGDVPAPHDR